MKTLNYLVLSSLLLAATSCLNQGPGKKIPGVNGPKVNVQDGKVLLSVELENVMIDLGLQMPISRKLPKSSVYIGPAMRDDGTLGGTLIKTSIDLEDVSSGKFTVVPNETLPDGRPFPYMIDGTLPSIAINVPKAKNATFYISEKVFGVFVPIKLSPNFQGSIHYRLKVNGKNYGIVSLINNDENNQGAGVFALLDLKAVKGDKGLKKLLKMSKKNKSRLY